VGRYSLATVTPTAVSVHRLVQAVIQARLGHEGDRRWAEIAVSLLHASFPNRELGAGWLLEQASTYLRGRGLYRQTRPIAERAVAMTEAARGPANPQVGWRCGELGHVLHDLGDLEGARVQWSER
jgi:hypothetical protein